MVRSVVVVASLCSILLGDRVATAEDAPAVPAFLKPGTRLTFRTGSTAMAGARKVLDTNGPLVDKDGSNFSLLPRGNDSQSGVGYTQLNVMRVAPGCVAADVENNLIMDVPHDLSMNTGTSLLINSENALGDYWISPAKLAQLRDGPDAIGGSAVTRSELMINNQRVRTVSISSVTPRGYDSKIYDRDTGILMSASGAAVDPGTLVLGPDGQSQIFPGTAVYTFALFVNARQVTLPWPADAAAPAWVVPGKTLDYRGEMQTVVLPHNGMNMPQMPPTPVNLSGTIDKDVGGGCVIMKMLSAAPGAGAPPAPSFRCLGSAFPAGQWLPPGALDKLRAGQVLDEDPSTKTRVTYAGIQNGVAVIASDGPLDRSETSYDPKSGVMLHVAAVQRPGGPTETHFQLQLAGQP